MPVELAYVIIFPQMSHMAANSCRRWRTHPDAWDTRRALNDGVSADVRPPAHSDAAQQRVQRLAFWTYRVRRMLHDFPTHLNHVWMTQLGTSVLEECPERWWVRNYPSHARSVGTQKPAHLSAL